MLKPVLVNLITVALKAFLEQSKKKDKTNSGALFAEWFFWDELETLAKNKGETLRKKLFSDGLLKGVNNLGAGSHELGETPGFIAMVKITEKVKTLDLQMAAGSLLRSHRVPLPTFLAAIEGARLPTGAPRKTITILER